MEFCFICNAIRVSICVGVHVDVQEFFYLLKFISCNTRAAVFSSNATTEILYDNINLI